MVKLVLQLLRLLKAILESKDHKVVKVHKENKDHKVILVLKVH